ncbi:NAD(P)-dependent oxidoreductase [Mameliella sp. AT18]|uniref:NAD-dependent epimerase/dehydratase family protein n=1 Tax=Mameliella sp. AT18 TaxID=3028385 RepID=UPI0008411C4D|nr:NAD(P)-dependent oxidoreductase [Mameliella sp. AT18]MDD9729485.1 NAD(P)-dependent oxidoreductase [Mameliella sp. AT18]ODM45413.1 NAD-dependent dehydratase [Ruegeria sp. PBVC088]
MIALTGASGLVGRFLLAGLPGPITVLGRHALPGHAFRPWDLCGPAPDLGGIRTLVHAAFSHLPGRYRGGEGDDPQGFLRANLDGTRRLFDAAVEAGVTRIQFLSSRAVFDGYPDDTPLTEDTAPQATSLYGQVKAEAEAHLAALPLIGQSLRATGIYGPGPHHKWESLFADYLAGRPIPPRRGTELHGADLAGATRLLLHTTDIGAFHLSDMLLDRHDLLGEVQQLTNCPHPVPPVSDRRVNPLICDRLPALGWRPGGLARLRADLPAMLPPR